MTDTMGALLLVVIALMITAVGIYAGYKKFKNADIVTSKGTYTATDIEEITRLRAGILEVLKTTRPGTEVEITVEASGTVRERMTFKLEAIEPG